MCEMRSLAAEQCEIRLPLPDVTQQRPQGCAGGKAWWGWPEQRVVQRSLGGVQLCC